MKFLVAFYRMLVGPPVSMLMEDLHARLINDWIANPGSAFLHPQCAWQLANGHPNQGVYRGTDFYKWYVGQLANTHYSWHAVVNEVIGSLIGGIVVGEYQFQYEANGLWYTAPFTHFYQIQQGKIVSIRYFMGEVNIRLQPLRPLLDLSSLVGPLSPN